MSDKWFLLYAAILLVPFAVGVTLLVRYMRTRRRLFLVLGLLFTFVLPGLLILSLAAGWLPLPGMVYAPPPHFTPPQATSTAAPSPNIVYAPPPVP